jgi:hypothetical protein
MSSNSRIVLYYFVHPSLALTGNETMLQKENTLIIAHSSTFRLHPFNSRNRIQATA